MTATSDKENADRFFKLGNYREAVRCYTSAIDNIRPADEDALLHILYSNRSASFLKLNDYAKALEDGTSCTQVKPTWFKGYNRKGAALLRLGRRQEAKYAYEKSLELSPSNNAEASEALRQLGGASGGDGANPFGGNPFGGFAGGVPGMGSLADLFANVSSFFPGAAGGAGRGAGAAGGATVLATVLMYLTQALGRSMLFWNGLSATVRQYISLGAVLLVVYFLFFRRSASYDDLDDYDYHYGGGGRGMSWTTWGMIMFAAYKVPPMFPDLLGDYARPFFGMNWTTFMWLLSMLNNNRGGRRGFGGFFGGPRNRYY